MRLFFLARVVGLVVWASCAHAEGAAASQSSGPSQAELDTADVEPAQWLTYNNRLDGQRISTAIAYLLPARGRPNLTIRPDCLVDRILVEGPRAVGVDLECLGSRETVFGHRITLSGGAIGSPTILLRSGIGPTDDLRVSGEIFPLIDAVRKAEQLWHEMGGRRMARIYRCG